MRSKIIFITMLATFALPSFGDQPPKSEGEMNIAKGVQQRLAGRHATIQAEAGCR